MQRCIHCLVSGHVQGVCFRAATQDRARELGVTGWVRNLADGRVEIRALGNDAAVEALRAWLGSGPEGGRVDQVAAREEDIPGDMPETFRVR